MVKLGEQNHLHLVDLPGTKNMCSWSGKTQG